MNITWYKAAGISAKYGGIYKVAHGPQDLAELKDRFRAVGWTYDGMYGKGKHTHHWSFQMPEGFEVTNSDGKPTLKAQIVISKNTIEAREWKNPKRDLMLAGLFDLASFFFQNPFKIPANFDFRTQRFSKSSENEPPPKTKKIRFFELPAYLEMNPGVKVKRQYSDSFENVEVVDLENREVLFDNGQVDTFGDFVVVENFDE